MKKPQSGATGTSAEDAASSISSAAVPRRHWWSSVPQEAWWIILAGSALRILFFFVGQNAGIDSIARACLTAEWLRHPGFRLVFAMWPPFHFWLMGAIYLLVGHVALAGRLLSLLLGIASLGIFWALTKEIYGAPAAKLSLLVFALYSLHIGYSTTSCSEVPYVFFVLTGLLGFFVYRRSGSHLALALGSVAFGIGSGVRYEAWLFIFALFFILVLFPSRHAGRVLGKAHVYEVALFGGIAGAWPVFWMIYQWKLYGMPLYGVTMNYTWVAEQLAALPRPLLYQLALFPGVIFLTLSPVILAAALYGLVRGLRERPGRDFAIVFLVLAAITGYQIVARGLLPLARYTITVGTLFAISSGYGIEQIASFLSQRRASQLRLGVTVLVALNLGGIFAMSRIPNRFNDKFRSISPDLRFLSRIDSIGRYLKPRLGPNTSVVIDHYNAEETIIAHVIGLPLLPHERVYYPSRNDLQGMIHYMKTKHPRYLIYSDRGVIGPYFPLPPECQADTIMDMKFQCVFQNDTYRVYSIRYQQAPAN